MRAGVDGVIIVTGDKENDVPRYEVVAHFTYNLDVATPEEAAAVLKRDVVRGGDEPGALRHLAVWQLSADGTPSPLTADLRRQLAAFFADVTRRAAAADEVFRTQVAAILAAGPHEADAAANDADDTAESPRTEPANLGEWETEGGRVSR